MIEHGLSFHHLGLATEKPSKAIAFIKTLGYSVSDMIEDPLQKVRLVWAEHNYMPAIEVIYPTEQPGPLDKILKNRNEMIYHVCYTSKNVESSIMAISNVNRIISIGSKKPAVLFDGKNVSFYLVSGFGLIEVIEIE